MQMLLSGQLSRAPAAAIPAPYSISGRRARGAGARSASGAAGNDGSGSGLRNPLLGRRRVGAVPVTAEMMGPQGEAAAAASGGAPPPMPAACAYAYEPPSALQTAAGSAASGVGRRNSA